MDWHERYLFQGDSAGLGKHRQLLGHVQFGDIRTGNRGHGFRVAAACRNHIGGDVGFTEQFDDKGDANGESDRTTNPSTARAICTSWRCFDGNRSVDEFDQLHSNASVHIDNNIILLDIIEF